MPGSGSVQSHAQRRPELVIGDCTFYFNEEGAPTAILTAQGVSFKYVEMLTKAVEQKMDGRTGGGPKCPSCGERSLRTVEEARNVGDPLRMQCTNPECYNGATLRVTVDGIELKAEGV